MEELKFRAWDKKNKCWYQTELTFVGFHIFGECTMICPPRASDLPNLEITQYSGLKDKNNQGDTDIYKNDIVYISGTGNCVVSICPILGASFRSISDDISVETAHDVLMEGDLGAVIGNIYENPELLKPAS